MNVRGLMVRLGRWVEKSWITIPIGKQAIELQSGWYIAEYHIATMLDHVPELLVETADNTQYKRVLTGAHQGPNRQFFYLPKGSLIAHDKAITLQRLERLSWLEGRARVLLICYRVLRDFFSVGLLSRLIAIQFRNSADLSTNLLQFYHANNYLQTVDEASRLLNFHPLVNRFLSWKYRHIRVAILVENQGQISELSSLLGMLPDEFLTQAELGKGDVKLADIDYLLPLQTVDSLHPAAIYLLKQAIAKSFKRQGRLPEVVYTDHDYIGDTRVEPAFKPDASLPYFYCADYLSMAVAVRANVGATERLADLLQDESRYCLLLSLFVKQPDNILHIDEVLFRSKRDQHSRTAIVNEAESQQTIWPGIIRKAGQGYNHLVSAQVESSVKSNTKPGAESQWPSVDLIVPTRDGLDVLQPCIDSLLNDTDYPRYHIYIVDNGSEKADTLAYFKEIQRLDHVSVLSYPGEFNYSAINNFAVAQGSSDYVALINNDIEVIKSDWLKQMMAWAQQDEVGIVGAKLLFGNGAVQHAGVTIGMGNAAGHIHRLEPGDSHGYQFRCVATQKMKAVTAACLLTSRAIYNQVDGLNEQAFKVAYNDIDFCLRVEQLGYDIIWTPEAVLYHHESVSRGDDMSDEHISRYLDELARFQRRWKSKGYVDKYYSKHLRIGDEAVYPHVTESASDNLVYLQR